MKLLIYSIIILVTGSLLALLARDDPGFVVMGYGNWTVEIALSLYIVLLLLLITGSYYLIRITLGVTHSPQRIAGWRIRRKQQKASRGS